MYQLHEGMPSHAGALVRYATIFEIKAATIAPLTRPSQAVKHPIARRRPRETGGPPTVSGELTISTAPRDAQRRRCPTSGEE